MFARAIDAYRWLLKILNSTPKCLLSVLCVCCWYCIFLQCWMACILYNMTYESNWLLIVNKTSTTTTWTGGQCLLMKFLYEMYWLSSKCHMLHLTVIIKQHHWTTNRIGLCWKWTVTIIKTWFSNFLVSHINWWQHRYWLSISVLSQHHHCMHITFMKWLASVILVKDYLLRLTSVKHEREFRHKLF